MRDVSSPGKVRAARPGGRVRGSRPESATTCRFAHGGSGPRSPRSTGWPPDWRALTLALGVHGLLRPRRVPFRECPGRPLITPDGLPSAVHHVSPARGPRGSSPISVVYDDHGGRFRARVGAGWAAAAATGSLHGSGPTSRRRVVMAASHRAMSALVRRACRPSSAGRSMPVSAPRRASRPGTRRGRGRTRPSRSAR